MTQYNPDEIRKQFPSLNLKFNGNPVIYFDGPGGTQVPQRVIEAVSRYYEGMNSNVEGAFLTSQRTDLMLADAHKIFADFLNARYSDEIKFNQNMTSHTFNISHAIGKTLRPGDEIIVTVLDHEANVSPWEALKYKGLKINTVDINPNDCTLDMADLEAKLSKKTKLIAVGYASNAVGTINNIRMIIKMAHAIGSLVYVDAVHYAPHRPIDVQLLNCDFLVCSVYKFFGPHLGVLFGKKEVLQQLPADKVRPAHDYFEYGTQNHEGIAGAMAAVEYLAELGQKYGSSHVNLFPNLSPRRLNLKLAMSVVHNYENILFEKLLIGLKQIPKLKMWGITDPNKLDSRTPTAAFTISGFHPREIAKFLGEKGIFVWDGDFYAQALIERLGLFNTGGVVRVGLTHYNTLDEIEQFLKALHWLVDRR